LYIITIYRTIRNYNIIVARFGGFLSDHVSPVVFWVTVSCDRLGWLYQRHYRLCGCNSIYAWQMAV